MRLAVVLVALAACGCAANRTLVSAPLPGQASTPTAGVRPDAASAGRPLSVAAAPDPDTLLTFHMPRLYANGDTLADGYRRWDVGYSSQSLVWRDSVAVYGIEWGRNLDNMPKWVPGAQIVWLLHGYARPGELVTVRRPLVSSLYWPYRFWARSWTSVPSRESNPTRSFVSND